MLFFTPPKTTTTTTTFASYGFASVASQLQHSMSILRLICSSFSMTWVYIHSINSNNNDSGSSSKKTLHAYVSTVTTTWTNTWKQIDKRQYSTFSFNLLLWFSAQYLKLYGGLFAELESYCSLIINKSAYFWHEWVLHWMNIAISKQNMSHIVICDKPHIISKVNIETDV